MEHAGSAPLSEKEIKSSETHEGIPETTDAINEPSERTGPTDIDSDPTGLPKTSTIRDVNGDSDTNTITGQDMHEQHDDPNLDQTHEPTPGEDEAFKQLETVKNEIPDEQSRVKTFIPDDAFLEKIETVMETFGATSWNLKQDGTFMLKDEGGNRVEEGTLEDLAFKAINAEKNRLPADMEEEPLDDPVLKTQVKLHPLNSLDDLRYLLKDYGFKANIDKDGDFYSISIFSIIRNVDKVLYAGTVPVNATKNDLTRFFYAAESAISPFQD